MSVWRTCPNCASNLYSQYTDGEHIKGYCQYCSCETKIKDERDAEERHFEKMTELSQRELSPRDFKPKKVRK